MLFVEEGLGLESDRLKPGEGEGDFEAGKGAEMPRAFASFASFSGSKGDRGILLASKGFCITDIRFRRLGMAGAVKGEMKSPLLGGNMDDTRLFMLSKSVNVEESKVNGGYRQEKDANARCWKTRRAL